MTVHSETSLQTTPTEAPTAAPAAPAVDLRRVVWSRPAVDVFERDDALLLVLDVPGVPADRFELRVEDRTLSVSGVRADGQRGWRRLFSLPPAVDSAGIEARAEHGVLTLTLPKSEAARPRRIEVR